MLFGGWEPLVRILVVGSLAYVALVLMVRVSGKRTLSKLNAFDLVVTVALGSTLATTLLSKDTALLDGVVALGLLILAQYLVTWTSVRWRVVDRSVKAEPTLVVRAGRPLPDALKGQRLTVGEIEAAARGAGIESLDAVEAVILETDGTLSVIGSGSAGEALR